MGRTASAAAASRLVRRGRYLLPGQIWTAPSSIVGPAQVSAVAAGGAAPNTSSVNISGQFSNQTVCLSGWVPTPFSTGGSNTIGVVSVHGNGGRIYPSPGSTNPHGLTYTVASIDDTGVTIVAVARSGTGIDQARMARTNDYYESNYSQLMGDWTPIGLAVNPSVRTDPAVMVGDAGRVYSLANAANSTSASDHSIPGISQPTGVKFLNGEYVMFGQNASNRPSVAVPTVPRVFSAWTTYVLDGAVTGAINDLVWAASLGLWVAVGASGRIYTATTLAGPWTLRTSGTAQPLRGVRFANGILLAYGDGGAICRSVDGITWTNPTGAGASNFTREACAYSAVGNRWYLGHSTGTGIVTFSTDNALTWTASANILSSNPTLGIHISGDRVVFVSNSTSIFTAPLNASPVAANVLQVASPQTTNRCDTIIFRDGVEQFRLRGGGNGLTGSVGGNGGSYRAPEPAGQGSGPGIGWAGRGGESGTAGTDRLRQTERGGLGSSSNGGGGGAPAFEMLMDAGVTNFFVPGASGSSAYNTNTPGSGGGGSIFAPGGNAFDVARLPGRGSCSWNDGSVTFGAGGGGEGVCRASVPVTAGSVIEASPGLSFRALPGSANSNGQCGGDGLVFIEWDEAA